MKGGDQQCLTKGKGLRRGVICDYWTAVQQQDMCEMTLEYFDQVSQNDGTLINILSVFYVRKYYQMSDNLGSVSRSFDLQMHPWLQLKRKLAPSDRIGRVRRKVGTPVGTQMSA